MTEFKERTHLSTDVWRPTTGRCQRFVGGDPSPQSLARSSEKSSSYLECADLSALWYAATCRRFEPHEPGQ